MIYIDFETRSKIDLKTSGSWVYSLHPSTEVLCMAFTKDDREVRVWKPTDKINLDSLRNLLTGELVEAHNAFFERAIWENIMVPRFGFPEIKSEQWRCSAAKAAYHAIPRSLENAGAALELSTIKDTTGKRVMMQLARPRNKSDSFYEITDAPDKFEKLYEYCKQDVEAERAIANALSELPEKELRIWQLDQKINHRGVPIDVGAVNSAIKMLNEYSERLNVEAVTIFGEDEYETIRTTENVFVGYREDPLADLKQAVKESAERLGLYVDDEEDDAIYEEQIVEEKKLIKRKPKSTNQRAKVLEWCADNGERVLDYTKAGVAAALTKVENPRVKRILEIRQALGKTSTAKYEAMLNSVAPDGRIRDTLMYHGAATGRWAGKKVQFQNLPKGSIKNMDDAVELIKSENTEAIEFLHGDFMPFMAGAIRGMVKASEGKMLVVADFAAIEARVLGWLAGSELMLQQFRNGVDLYKEMASKIYNVSVEEVTSDQRQLGKAAILGAGYGMGAPKFLDTCLSWGIKIDEALAKTAIATYRETYPEVRNLWENMDRMAKNATLGCIVPKICHTSWFVENAFLKCQLPSGRSIHFYKPEIRDKETPWGIRPALTFMGEKQGTTGGKTWMRVDTYGGKLVENITQAVARDLMAEAMLRVEAAGYEVILSIHDELVAEVDESKADVSHFEKLMSEVPTWATGCPISAAGWSGKHYKK